MKNCFVVLAATVIFASVAFAGFDLSFNPLVRGDEDFGKLEIVSGTTYEFDGNVQYAVYAPGEYTELSMPSEHYVYAYQINNLSDIEVSNFSIGLIPGGVAENVSYIQSGAEVAPVLAQAGSQQVGYVFLTDPIGAGESSALLVFSSVNGPVDGIGSLSFGTIGSSNGVLPTPVPEPVTIILLGGGSLLVRSFGRNRYRG